MKLIVGLGNPGKEYNNTRHNVGFYMIDNYLGMNVTWKSKFNGLFCEKVISGEKIMFLKPQSYMNLSGEVIRKFIDYYKIMQEDLLVINDDLDLELGCYRLRASGSSGGHNGLKNIENHLGSNNYKRLKIGISNNKNIETKDYVLDRFSNNEQKVIDDLLEVVSNIIDDFVTTDFSVLMNKYNRKNG